MDIDGTSQKAPPGLLLTIALHKLLADFRYWLRLLKKSESTDFAQLSFL
jgi:hypothetical protein